eukprot:543462-Prorocentrum_minimum.AAC.3
MTLAGPTTESTKRAHPASAQHAMIERLDCESETDSGNRSMIEFTSRAPKARPQTRPARTHFGASRSVARGRYTGVLDALRRVAVLEGGKKALYSGAATMSAWTLASCTLHPCDARFHPYDARFRPCDARLNPCDARFNPCDARSNPCNARLNPCDARFRPCDARFNPCDARFDPCDA